MTRECLLCGAVEVDSTPLFCDYCYPQTCINCHVSAVTYDKQTEEFKCSHGCTYDAFEYTTRKMYTVLLNGDWKDKLSLAGERVEYIIPNTESITIHTEIPDTLPSNHILGTHYTDSQELLETREYSADSYDGAERFDGTIRENAAYAWPHTPEYTEEHFEWNREYVIFEVPKSEVYVSSYQFLNWVSNSGEKYTIPVSKYKSELTFTPDQLLEVCQEKNRPTQPENLFGM